MFVTVGSGRVGEAPGDLHEQRAVGAPLVDDLAGNDSRLDVVLLQPQDRPFVNALSVSSRRSSVRRPPSAGGG